jgi:hypothetical protein
MFFGKQKIVSMHLLTLPFLVWLITRVSFRNQGPNLILCISIGLAIGVAVGFLFYRFYLGRLVENTVNLRGFRFPHVLIYAILWILRFPLFGVFNSLYESGQISAEMIATFLRLSDQILNGFVVSCLLSSVIVEAILLFLWQKRHNQQLYADLGSYFGTN